MNISTRAVINLTWIIEVTVHQMDPIDRFHGLVGAQEPLRNGLIVMMGIMFLIFVHILLFVLGIRDTRKNVGQEGTGLGLRPITLSGGLGGEQAVDNRLHDKLKQLLQIKM
jgi:hypothetical protein